jgi:phosphate transport system permease protein
MSTWSVILLFIFLLCVGAPTLLIFAQAFRAGGLRCTNQEYIDQPLRITLFCCAVLAVLTTIGIVGSLFYESLRFFQIVMPHEFLFGLQWNPQIAAHSEQVVSDSSFGAIPLFVGTLLISCIALVVATPIGLLSAIYLAEYASALERSLIKPLLEVLAGIPTVVYGFFAALTVAPLIKSIGEHIGLSVASESALAAGIVMGIMLIPFISSLSDDVIFAVPQNLKEGSLALGATKAETIMRVILPAALPGLMGAFLLSVSRALGETMIVVMAAGMAAQLTINPLDRVTTITVQIVAALIGDQEFNNPKTLAAFALGLTLFVVTMVFNVLAIVFVKRFREKYE